MALFAVVILPEGEFQRVLGDASGMFEVEGGRVVAIAEVSDEVGRASGWTTGSSLPFPLSAAVLDGVPPRSRCTSCMSLSGNPSLEIKRLN